MSGHDDSALHDSEALSAARRRGVAAAAGHANDEPAARAALKDPSPGVRASALASLVRMHAATIEDLESAFGDPSTAVRRRAGELAWRSGAKPTQLAELLTRQLDSTGTDPSVLEAVCHSIGELRPPRLTAQLAAVATGHDDPLCREGAVAALGAIGEPDALATILRALEDRPAIRRRAVLALSQYEGPQVDAALARALEDRDWQVRQAAEDLSGARGRAR